MAKRKIPGMGRFKRIAKWAAPIGLVLGVIVFALDFFNIYIDFISRGNRPPEIHDGIQISRNIIPVGETLNAMVMATDPEGDELEYFWGSSCGNIQLDRFGGPKITYIAPDQPGIDFITVTVYDQEGATDRDFEVLTIIEAETTGSP